MAASVNTILTSCVIKIVKPVEIFYENVVLKNSSCFCNLTTPVITDNGMFFYYMYLILMHCPLLLRRTEHKYRPNERESRYGFLLDVIEKKVHVLSNDLSILTLFLIIKDLLRWNPF